MKLQSFFRNSAKTRELHVSDCLSERILPSLEKKSNAINPSFVIAVLFIDNPVKLFFMEAVNS